MRLFTKTTKNKQGTKETIWVDFTFEGKRYRKSLKLDNTPKNRKLATSKLIPEMQYKLNNGELFNKPTVPTINEMYKKSYALHSPYRKYSTNYANISIFNNHIGKDLGSKRLDELRYSDFVLYFESKLQTLSPKTVLGLKNVLSQIYNDAVKDEIVHKNPILLCNHFSATSQKEIKPFGMDEIKLILKEIPLKYRLYFAIAFYGGLRGGENLALTVDDIDLDKMVIKVTKTKNKGRTTAPKTGGSIRDVEILDILVPYIKEHLEVFKPINDLFLNNRGKPFNTFTHFVSHHWYKALTKLGLDKRNPHQMRHTFASLMISNDENILWVSKMLGHANPNTTLRVYSRYVKSDETRRKGSFLL